MAPDEDLAESIVGPHQAVLDAEPAAEPERPRLLRKERIGARLDQAPVGALGRDRAAEAVARFDHGEVDGQGPLPRQLDGTMGRGEARDTGADDDELHEPPAARTSSASILTNSG